MLLEPIRLKSPAGQNLEIQLETHVYTQEESQEGLKRLQGKQFVGYEGARLSAVEIIFLESLYKIALFFYSLPSRIPFIKKIVRPKKRSEEFPTMQDHVWCAAVHQRIRIPLHGAEKLTGYCRSVFGDAPPNLPDLREAGLIEPPWSPATRFFWLSFMGMVCSSFVCLALGAASLVSRKKVLWETGKRIRTVAFRGFNVFAWPQWIYEKRGGFLSPRMKTGITFIEQAFFCLAFSYQMFHVRNQDMARLTDQTIHQYNQQENMIIVGSLHRGIADILVERYHYRREQLR